MTAEFDWLKRWSLYSPEKICLIDGDSGAEWTYAQFCIFTQKLAQVLKENFDVRKGDRICVVAPNSCEYVALFFAAQRLGACLVPVNTRLTEKEISHILGDAEPKLTLSESDLADLSAKALLGEASCLETFEAKSDDLALILYTSGTTGLPKGAMISNAMIHWNSLNTALRLNITQNDCAVIFLPLFHTGGWNVLTTPIFHHGGTIILTKKFDAEKILQLSASHQATLIFGVPTTMNLMSQSPSFKSIDLKRVRYAIVGGEPMPVDWIQTWHHKGISIRQGYGLTEFGPNVFSLNEEDAIRKIGSVGFPNFYIQCRLLDENQKAVADGEVGELWLNGPCCMTGYWKNASATQETIQNSWLATGDLARRDEEGYYYIVGRKKDMFISGGENVYPAEIENGLCEHPAVREAAVIGVADPKWGEVGKAFLVIDHKISTEDLEKYCRDRFAKFKIPKYFEFLDELPKGSSGKILKKQLQALT